MCPPEEPETIHDDEMTHCDLISRVVYFPISLYIRLFRKSIFRNIRKKPKISSAIEPASAFVNNSVYMHSICKAKKIRFYSVLQPANGIGPRNLTEIDRNLLKNARNIMVTKNQSRLDFFTEYYTIIRRMMAGRACFVDMSGIFDDMTDQVFFDSVHFSDRGQKIVSQALCDLIRESEDE